MIAIETEYRGYRFRSRLEARWAVFFDALGIVWEYEFEGFHLDNGSQYLPDFWLPRFHYPIGIYVEVKPPGGGFEKAVEFVMSGGGAILCADGTPDDRPYRLVQPNHSHPRGLMDASTMLVAFRAKYLPGGINEREYRLYWDPHQDEFDDGHMEVDHAIYAARAARFEHRAAGR